MGKVSIRQTDDIYFSFFRKLKDRHFMEIVSKGDILREMTNPIFYNKIEKYFKMSSVESFTQHANCKDIRVCSRNCCRK